MKRKICLILALIMICVALVSCDETEGDGESVINVNPGGKDGLVDPTGGGNIIDVSPYYPTTPNPSRCYYCNGTGKITCQVCFGKGYDYTKTDFINGKTVVNYHTCSYCHGSLTNTCYHCNGSGVLY